MIHAPITDLQINNINSLLLVMGFQDDEHDLIMHFTDCRKRAISELSRQQAGCLIMLLYARAVANGIQLEVVSTLIEDSIADTAKDKKEARRVTNKLLKELNITVKK